MDKKQILVVEDEDDIRELVCYNLIKTGYNAIPVASGESALDEIELNHFDLIVLDLMLPGIDGLSLCRKLKNDALVKHIPIVMLTAKGEESDIVAGLELGADDYITKPFSPKVLAARIKAVIRRREEITASGDDIIRIHELIIHPGRHEVRASDQLIMLTPTEFQILHHLARRPGWVSTRYQIVDAVHGENYPVTERSVDFQIVGLRKKLGDAGKYIETVRGIGYRFKE